MDICTKINHLLKKDFEQYKNFLKEEDKKKSGYVFYPTSHEALVSYNDSCDDFVEYGDIPYSSVQRCSIFFYEFSSTDKGCKHFVSTQAFFDFVEKHGIKLKESDASLCRIFVGNLWAACYDGVSDAFVARSRSELVKTLNENK